jgi:hypothetical protein
MHFSLKGTIIIVIVVGCGRPAGNGSRICLFHRKLTTTAGGVSSFFSRRRAVVVADQINRRIHGVRCAMKAGYILTLLFITLLTVCNGPVENARVTLDFGEPLRSTIVARTKLKLPEYLYQSSPTIWPPSGRVTLT